MEESPPSETEEVSARHTNQFTDRRLERQGIIVALPAREGPTRTSIARNKKDTPVAVHRPAEPQSFARQVQRICQALLQRPETIRLAQSLPQLDCAARRPSTQRLTKRDFHLKDLL